MGRVGPREKWDSPTIWQTDQKKHLYLVYFRAKLVGDQHYRTTSFSGLQLQRYRGRVKNPIFLRYTVIRLAAYQAEDNHKSSYHRELVMCLDNMPEYFWYPWCAFCVRCISIKNGDLGRTETRCPSSPRSVPVLPAMSQFSPFTKFL